MTYAILLAYSSFGESAAPYFTPMSRSVSHSSGNGKSNFSAKLRFSSGRSKLTPMTCAFFALNSVSRSRNPEPSLRQPGVSAFG
jgi:hypothetical protein